MVARKRLNVTLYVHCLSRTFTQQTQVQTDPDNPYCRLGIVGIEADNPTAKKGNELDTGTKIKFS